jgi:hypothetical protein
MEPDEVAREEFEDEEPSELVKQHLAQELDTSADCPPCP